MDFEGFSEDKFIINNLNPFSAHNNFLFFQTILKAVVLSFLAASLVSFLFLFPAFGIFLRQTLSFRTIAQTFRL